MFRDGLELLTEKRVNFVFNHGALGDVICSLPAVIQGRREVWLRIQNHLQLTPDQLWELYSGRPSKGE